MKPAPMTLLNCIRCDDVVKLVEKLRFCECTLSSGRTEGAHVLASGSCRVLTIDWEVYDGLAEGTASSFSVLPRAQYRVKGSL